MSKKQNILFILHVPPPVHGSSMVGQFIKNSALINDSFECRYINLLMSRTLNETGKSSMLKIFRFLGVWFRLLAEIIKKKPAICYLALTATGSSFYKDVFLVILLRIFHIKRVYHLHNKGIQEEQSKKLNHFLYKYVFQGAYVIILAKQLYRDIKQFVPTSKVYICPNGIKDTATGIKPRLHPADKPVKILFLSNLIESKGVFILLEACSILQQKGVDFECEFIGDVGDVSIQKFESHIINNNLNKKVRHLGPQYNEDKRNAFLEADIFAFPTYYHYETFGLVNLEAMQYCLPIVSTYEGGIPDIVENGKTGYLVPQKDAVALANRLEILIKDQALREKMGKAGRIKYEQKFTLDIFEQRLNEILHEIVEKQ